MNGTGAGADGSRGAFSLDSTVPGGAPEGFGTFQEGWEDQFGGGFRLPVLSPGTAGDFRLRGLFARVRDVTLARLHGVSAISAGGNPGGDHDLVGMYVVRSGSWTVGGPRERGERTVPAGRFLFGRLGRQVRWGAPPDTRSELLFLPAAVVGPLLGGRVFTGPADSAEMRLLAAHMDMVHATVADLGPAGVHAAHGTLAELAKAAVTGRFDDTEPRLAPTLARAAQSLANRHLADPGLSPAMLARELNVSVRTLQRAFTATGEPVTAYIRRRRLEEARLALTAPRGRLSVSELAAHWQFADGSHFIRAFKKRYGRTPAEYARSAGPAGPAGN